MKSIAHPQPAQLRAHRPTIRPIERSINAAARDYHRRGERGETSYGPNASPGMKGARLRLEAAKARWRTVMAACRKIPVFVVGAQRSVAVHRPRPRAARRIRVLAGASVLATAGPDGPPAPRRDLSAPLCAEVRP
jgi:hypothetical protein